MDIQKECATLDPQIPLHISFHHRHHTWARTFHSYPELYIQPRTTEELRKTVDLARRCRRRISLVGCAHSPSDLTCTSSWLVNIDHLDKILDINEEAGVVVMQAGIRLRDLGMKLKEHRLAMPNLGSIDDQSIAGAISTATHGSCTRHGLLSQSVLALKIMLADGRLLSCSKEQSSDLFRAALVSLGALGIITEVTFQAVPTFNVEWDQSLQPLESLLSMLEKGLWTTDEFTRIWWMPYKKKAIVWTANKTPQALRPPPSNFLGGVFGFHTYHTLLYIAQWIPRILPYLETFVMHVQYGLKEGTGQTAVEEWRTGLLMNCLFSQFVNEWAIPLKKGPEAISRLSKWMHGEPGSNIPFSSRGLYVHAPIEVRVTDISTNSPRPYLDNTCSDDATLYINATLYRPYHNDPPCRKRYYEAFEWLMKEMGGRPHWAKNFSTVTKENLSAMYPDLGEWIRVRNEVDPEGMFIADWHRRLLLTGKTLPLEERKTSSKPNRGGGVDWFGEVKLRKSNPDESEQSFDPVQGLQDEKNTDGAT